MQRVSASTVSYRHLMTITWEMISEEEAKGRIKQMRIAVVIHKAKHRLQGHWTLRRDMSRLLISVLRDAQLTNWWCKSHYLTHQVPLGWRHCQHSVQGPPDPTAPPINQIRVSDEVWLSQKTGLTLLTWNPGEAGGGVKPALHKCNPGALAFFTTGEGV